MDAKSLVDRRSGYRVEEVFKDYKEYLEFLKEALVLFQDLKKSRNLSLRKYVPDTLEIQFAKVKAPSIHFPRYKGTIVVQLPEGKLSPKQKGVLRERALLQYCPLVKIHEICTAEQFAMTNKIFKKKNSSHRP